MHNDFKVGPEYCPPAAAVSEDWIDSDSAQVIPYPPDCPDWWSVFNDPILNDLVQTAYDQNLSLREAGWRVMQARAQRAIAAGNLLPQTQQGFGQYEHVLNSKNLAASSPLRTLDQWSTGATLAWELDVWGRYRRAIDSADANLEASVGDYDAIMIGLVADVATAYADYRTFQQRLEYAGHNADIQEKSLELTQAKADRGATGYIGVHLAKSSLESTRATIPNLEIGLRQASNQLCTLLGLTTHDLSDVLGTDAIPTAPVEIAVGIPADLLRRRPDIRAAERALAAQSEQIGIAVTNLYPHFTINGQFALESEDFSHLFSSSSSAGSIGPSFHWDLLNYGRIVNNARLQEAGFQELVASYQKSVLTANQEVEDALIAFLRNQERVEFLQATVEETQEALRLLTISYEQGAIDFDSIFILQGALVAAQDQLASTQGDVVTSLISLYKALGGGWEIRCPEVLPCGVASMAPESLEVVPVPETVPLPAMPNEDTTTNSLEPPPVFVEPLLAD
jgi:NodT family efflux transporter outer membrane factor (OMF) lipoprotein